MRIFAVSDEDAGFARSYENPAIHTRVHIYNTREIEQEYVTVRAIFDVKWLAFYLPVVMDKNIIV